MENLFVIRCVNDPYLYWNNKTGYGYLSTALVANFRERHTLTLPDEGEWVALEQAILKLENIAETAGVDL
jgi:hypothetical protein